MAFESRVAVWLGARSYSTYILHSPIISIAAFLILPLHPFTRIEALGILAAVVTPSTLLASHLLYRYVEMPMIRLGARLAARRRPVATTATAPAGAISPQES
jgi:peptidoglycan/LPS O-acetylase OafA/YrhL